MYTSLSGIVIQLIFKNIYIYISMGHQLLSTPTGMGHHIFFESKAMGQQLFLFHEKHSAPVPCIDTY